jgi:hypothetical protein
MYRSLQYIKEDFEVIVKVAKKNNKLLFYSANNLIIPKKIISTTNLKSISVYTTPVTKDNCASGYYITNFEYHNDDIKEQIQWRYAVGKYNWESETSKLINTTIELA